MAKQKVNYEDVLAKELDELGVQYIREYKFHKTRRWRLDFFLPDYNLAVEVEGVKWRGVGRHQTAQGFTGDAEKYNTLTLMGIFLLRMTPQMVNGTAKRNDKAKTKMDKAIDVIKKFTLGKQ